MKLNKKLTMGMAAVLLGAISFNQSFAANISANKKITVINTFETYATIAYEPASGSNLGCSGARASSYVVVDWASDPDAKAMYAAILSAKLTNGTIGFGTAGCHPWGSGTPLVYRVTAK